MQVVRLAVHEVDRGTVRTMYSLTPADAAFLGLLQVTRALFTSGRTRTWVGEDTDGGVKVVDELEMGADRPAAFCATTVTTYGRPYRRPPITHFVSTVEHPADGGTDETVKFSPGPPGSLGASQVTERL